MISIHLLDEVLYPCPGIRDFSVSMTPDYLFQFQILGEAADLDEIRGELLLRWPHLSFRLERTKELPSLGNGKRKISRRETSME